MEDSRNLHVAVENIFAFQDEDFWIEASSIQATFGDGSSMDLDTISVNATTPMGIEILLTSDDIQHPKKRSIRLILIRPEQDWRMNADYAWKLDNAWMADQLSPSAPTYSWLHWNVESYIDSQIQVPQFNNLWYCKELEFHFKAINEGSSRGQYPSTQIEPMVTLTDVRIGAMMSQSPNEFQIYNPPECNRQEVCKFVDGEIESDGGIFHNLLDNKDSRILFGGITCLIVLGLLMVGIATYRRRNGRSKEYEPIQGVESQLTEK